MRARISGLVTCRQRPGSANGVVFMTIEDESAVANVIVWPKVFERVRPIVLGARYVAVSGRVQEESGVIHVVAEQLEDLTICWRGSPSTAPRSTALARCDEVRRPIEERVRHECRQAAATPRPPDARNAGACRRSRRYRRAARRMRRRGGCYCGTTSPRPTLMRSVSSVPSGFLIARTNRDMRAGLQLALVARRVSQNRRIRRHDDLLLAVLVLDVTTWPSTLATV